MIKKLFKNKTSRQTLFLFTAQIFGMGVGFLSNIFLAKQMGSHYFGLYSFTLAIITFMSIFFEFGYFASASRLLAINHDAKHEKELIGASMVILTVISVIFFVSIFCISFLVDMIFEDKVGGIIRLTSAVSWSFVVPFFLELIFKGSNHIENLAGFNLSWKILFLLSIVILYALNLLSVENILFYFSLSCLLSFLFFITRLKPSFLNLKQNISNIFKENSVYGFKIYIGRVTDFSAININKILLGYFFGSRNIGFYNIATSFSSPISLLSIALFSSKFKSFAALKEIPTRLLKINLLFAIAFALIIDVVGFVVIKIYLTEYQGALMPIFILSISMIFQAMYQPYNVWLAGNGYAQELKISSFQIAFVAISGNLILIPIFGIMGVAVASLVTSIFILYVYIKIYNAKSKK